MRLNTKQLAKHFGISISRVLHLRIRGLPHHQRQAGCKIYYLLDEVLAWQQKHYPLGLGVHLPKSPEKSVITRAHNILLRLGVKTLEDVARLTVENLFVIRGCNSKTIETIQRALIERGMHLKDSPTLEDVVDKVEHVRQTKPRKFYCGPSPVAGRPSCNDGSVANGPTDILQEKKYARNS